MAVTDNTATSGANPSERPPDALIEATTALLSAVTAITLPLDLATAEPARRARTEIEHILTTAVLPRLRTPDAPLLCALAGPTGVGKSTLLNALAGTTLSATGPLRPTTRTPVLVCNPADLAEAAGDDGGAADGGGERAELAVGSAGDGQAENDERTEPPSESAAYGQAEVREAEAGPAAGTDVPGASAAAKPDAPAADVAETSAAASPDSPADDVAAISDAPAPGDAEISVPTGRGAADASAPASSDVLTGRVAASASAPDSGVAASESAARAASAEEQLPAQSMPSGATEPESVTGAPVPDVDEVAGEVAGPSADAPLPVALAAVRRGVAGLGARVGAELASLLSSPLPSPSLPRGVALVDTVDGDVAVVGAADVVVVVVSAERYADAAVWRILRRVGRWGVPVVVVLGRVSAGVEDEVAGAFVELLRVNGFGAVPFFVVEEVGGAGVAGDDHDARWAAREGTDQGLQQGGEPARGEGDEGSSEHTAGRDEDSNSEHTAGRDGNSSAQSEEHSSAQREKQSPEQGGEHRSGQSEEHGSGQGEEHSSAQGGGQSSAESEKQSSARGGEQSGNRSEQDAGQPGGAAMAGVAQLGGHAESGVASRASGGVGQPRSGLEPEVGQLGGGLGAIARLGGDGVGRGSADVSADVGRGVGPGGALARGAFLGDSGALGVDGGQGESGAGVGGGAPGEGGYGDGGPERSGGPAGGTGFEVGGGAGVGAGSDSGAESGPEAESEAKSETISKAESETNSGAESETESEAESETTSEAGSESISENNSEAESEAESGSETKAGSGVSVGSVAVIGSSPPLVPEAAVAGLRGWLREAGAVTAGRVRIGMLGVAGRLDSVDRLVGELADAWEGQRLALEILHQGLDRVHTAERVRFRGAVDGGELLGGEVRIRWQELLGSGRVSALFEAEDGGKRRRRHKRADADWSARFHNPAAHDAVTAPLRAALVEAVARGHRAALERAARKTVDQWELTPGAPEPASLDPATRRATDPVRAAAEWLDQLPTLILDQGHSRRTTRTIGPAGAHIRSAALVLGVAALAGNAEKIGDLDNAENTGSGTDDPAATAAVGLLRTMFGHEDADRLLTAATTALKDSNARLLERASEPHRAQLAAYTLDPRQAQALAEARAAVARARSEGGSDGYGY